MSSVTFPSKSVTILDLPEVSDLNVSFVYNFYESGESDSDADEVPEYISGADADFVLDTAVLELPRFVAISFSNPDDDDGEWSGLPDSVIEELVSSDSGRLQAEYDSGNIVNEESLTTSLFTGLTMQPTHFPGTLYSLFSGSIEAIASLGIGFNTSEYGVGSRNDDVTSFVSGFESTGLASETKALLVKALSNPQAEGYSTEVSQESAPSAFDNIASSLLIGSSINNHVIGHVVQSAAESGGNFFYSSHRASVGTAESISASARSDSSTVIKISDYVPAISEADVTPMYVVPTSDISDDIGEFMTSSVLVGYVIEKSRASPGGNIEDAVNLVVPGPSSTTITDGAIRYGYRYQYRVRAVYLTQFKAVTVVSDDEPGGYAYVGLLVASRGAPIQTVYSIDSTAPPPPTDVFFDYDPESEGLQIFWDNPVNTQMDISKYQVFRRNTVSDPFMLIHQITFREPSSDFETVPDSLNDESNGIKTFYTDETFNRDSEYIYAIAAVDVHGLSSNYSAQFRVSYDFFKGGVRAEHVSISGAPKPYPNIFLQGDLFSDTIKDSGHEKLQVYFDPEYLTVTSETGDDLNLIPTSTAEPSPSYKLNMINIDLQDAKTYNIFITNSLDE